MDLSPFGLLDARASLRLVADLVHEDDALCLALTCRPLRDALWMRFPRPPPGDAFAGARVRMRDKAVVSTVGRLAWARGLARPWPGPRKNWPPNSWRICARAAMYGALASLQWARANGCEWDADTCTMAAAGGHLEVLQWARANGCAWNRADCLFWAGDGSGMCEWIDAQPA